ncbi:MAG: hypothetical protein AB1762_11150 [Gemmatimonadota bacterium]
MREPEPRIAELVERIVRDAKVPNEDARDDLRRELLSHFEDAPSDGAVDRFGSPAVVADEFKRAYGGRRRLLYAGKVIASIVVSVIVALAWQILVNLRLEPVSGALRIGSWYASSALISIFLIAVAVLAWEIGVEPLCTRLEHRPLRLLGAILALSAGAYVTHSIIDDVVQPEHAVMGSAATIAVWVSTIAILARFELAYIRRVTSN